MINKFLIFLLTITIANFSLAGAPHEDPVVNQLRNEFKNALSPDLNEISGKYYECKGKIATEGNMGSDSLGKIHFSSHAGMILLSVPKSSIDNMLMVNNGYELIGTVSLNNNNFGYQAFRITQDGYLISEWSTRNVPGTPLAPYARTNQKAGVVSYGICSLTGK